MKLERTGDRIKITDTIVLQYVAVNRYNAKLNDHAKLSTQVR
jgi:hypothetical protein